PVASNRWSFEGFAVFSRWPTQQGLLRLGRRRTTFDGFDWFASFARVARFARFARFGGFGGFATFVGSAAYSGFATFVGSAAYSGFATFVGSAAFSGFSPFGAGLFKLAVVGHYGCLNELDRSRIDAGNGLELLGCHGAQAFDGADAGLQQLLRQGIAHSIVEQNGNRGPGRH